MQSICGVAVVALILLGQDATPVASLMVDHGRLSPKATYKALMTGAPGKPADEVGKIVFETKIDGDKVFLTDTVTMRDEFSEGTETIKTECEKDALLTLRTAEVTPPDPKQGSKFSIVVADDKSTLTVKADGQDDRQAPFPKGAVYGLAVFRIPSLLPQEEGKRYSVSQILDPEVKGGSGGEVVFVCEGKTTFERDGKKIECVKFTVEGSDHNPPMEYYVDDAGVLERVVLAGRQVMDLVKEDSTQKLQ